MASTFRRVCRNTNLTSRLLEYAIFNKKNSFKTESYFFQQLCHSGAHLTTQPSLRFSDSPLIVVASNQQNIIHYFFTLRNKVFQKRKHFCHILKTKLHTLLSHATNNVFSHAIYIQGTKNAYLNLRFKERVHQFFTLLQF